MWRKIQRRGPRSCGGRSADRIKAFVLRHSCRLPVFVFFGWPGKVGPTMGAKRSLMSFASSAMVGHTQAEVSVRAKSATLPLKPMRQVPSPGIKNTASPQQGSGVQASSLLGLSLTEDQAGILHGILLAFGQYIGVEVSKFIYAPASRAAKFGMRRVRNTSARSPSCKSVRKMSKRKKSCWIKVRRCCKNKQGKNSRRRRKSRKFGKNLLASSENNSSQGNGPGAVQKKLRSRLGDNRARHRRVNWSPLPTPQMLNKQATNGRSLKAVLQILPSKKSFSEQRNRQGMQLQNLRMPEDRPFPPQSMVMTWLRG